MEVQLVAEYPSTRNHIANAMGSIQVLDNYNALVDYGFEPEIAEFTPGGDRIFDMIFGSSEVHSAEVLSYRAFKSDWWVTQLLLTWLTERTRSGCFAGWESLDRYPALDFKMATSTFRGMGLPRYQVFRGASFWCLG